MGFKLERIRAICFDIDGTLSDTDDQFVEKLAKYLYPLRLFCSREEIHSTARRIIMTLESPVSRIYNLADKFGIDDLFAKIFIWLKKLVHYKKRDKTVLIPGVMAMLGRLKPIYKLAVVSARGETSAQAFLGKHRLQRFFDVIVTANTCYYTKPFPDPVLYAAKKMGVTAGECLIVGDTAVDIKAGKRAGAQTIGVLCGFGTRRELEKAGANKIVSNTPDIMWFLK